MYNKRKFNKVNDKKVLHKVKKQWVVLSLSMLAMIGVGGAIATQTHASTVNAPQVRQEKQVAPKQNSNNISDKAKAIHQQLMSNSVVHNDTNNDLKNNSTQLGRSYTLQNTTPLNKSANKSKLKLLSTDNTSAGKWGNAYYYFNGDTGALTIMSNKDMDYYDPNYWPLDPKLHLNPNSPSDIKYYNQRNRYWTGGGKNTITSVRFPNTSLATPNDVYQADMTQFKNKYMDYMEKYYEGSDFTVPSHSVCPDIHFEVNPADVKSINVASNDNTVQLPNDSSYVFANLPNLTSVDLTGLHAPSENGNSSDITSTSHMFANDPNLQSVTLGNSINASDVNDMSSMFSDDPSLINIDLGSSFNASHVRNLNNMFADDRSLQALDLSQINTSYTNSMKNMLKGTTGLQNLTLGLETKLNNTVNLSNTWYKHDVNDNYTDNIPTNLTNGMFNPGLYTTHENSNPNNNSTIINGTWGTASYSFNKQTGLLKTTSTGEIDAVNDSLLNNNSINLNDITQIQVNNNNSIINQATGVFANLPNLKTIDLQGLNTTGMIEANSMFANDPSLTSINFGNDFNTSNVVTMNGMFAYDKSLSNLDLSHFNTSEVLDMSGMFNNDSSLNSLDLSHFDTSNVQDMDYMFNDNSSLNSLNLSQFNTSKVFDMAYMFNNDSSLRSIIFGHNFTTNRVTDMSRMFASDSKLVGLDLSNFVNNPNNSNNLTGMFYKDSNLSDLDLSNFNTGSNNGTELVLNCNVSGMLYGLRNLKILHLGQNTILPSTTDMPNNIWYKKYPDGYTSETPTDMWTVNDNLEGTYVTVPHVNPSETTVINGVWGTAPFTFNPVTGVLRTTGPGTINDISNITQLVNQNDNIFNLKPGSIDPSKIREIQFAPGTKAPDNTMGLFASTKLSDNSSDGTSHYSTLYNLSDIDLHNLDTSNVNTMRTWFAYDPDLQHIDNLSYLNTSSVQDMNSMFLSDSRLSSLDMTSLNLYKLQNAQNMFKDDSNLSSLKLSSKLGFNASLKNISGMFESDTSLNAIDMGSDFNTSNVSNMSKMFFNDTNLSNLDLGLNFNTQSAINMSDMFSGDDSLKSLNLGSHFNTVNVNDMYNMFGNDTNLQNINLGENFNTSQAFSNKVPEYTYQGAWQELLLIGYFNGASDVFSNDTSLNTIKGSNIQLNDNVDLPMISGENWYLQNNKGQLMDNPVDLTNGNQYSGTYVLNKTISNPIVQTTLQFMDGSTNIGNLIVTGYVNSPIPYGVIENSLGDGYSPNIPTRELAMNIPNSPYKYKSSTIQVPVKRDGESSGTNPVSASYVTLQGNINLHFTDNNGNAIKTITIPYSIDGLPIGSKVSDILSHATPSVNKPSDYLGKNIQSFSTDGYVYQNGSNDYLNVPITASDGKNASGTSVDGNPVTHNLTFNFKSNKVNEHIQYMYNSTPEGSDNILGEPGENGSDSNNAGLVPGFEVVPGSSTSFTFSNNGHMTVNVKPESVKVPFEVEDNSNNQVLNGMSNLTSVNQLTVNEPGDIEMSSSDLGQLINDGYQLDNGQSITVPVSAVSSSMPIYTGNQITLYAHKVPVTVPVHYIYNSNQIGSDNSINGTEGTNISFSPSMNYRNMPLGYQFDASNLNNPKNYVISNVSKNNGYYQTDPVNIYVQPILTTNYIKYMNGPKQIGSSYEVTGYDSRSKLGHDTFTINSVHPAGLENGYHVDNNNQTIHLNNNTYSVNVSPDTLPVAVEFQDVTNGHFLSINSSSDVNANGLFTVDTPKQISLSDSVLSNLHQQGYQLSNTNNYNLKVTSNEVNSDGVLYPAAEPTLKVTPISFSIPVEYRNDNNDLVEDVMPITNQTVHSTPDLVSYAQSNVPSGYQLITNGRNNDLSSWKIADHIMPSGDNTDKVVVYVESKSKQITSANAEVNYIYNNHPVNAAPVIIGSGNEQSTITIGSNPIELPNGYKVITPTQTIIYNNQPQNVKVAPKQAAENINYVNDQGNIVRTVTVSGDSSATGLASSHFTVGNTPNGLPSGYQVEDPSQVINYDGGNHTIMIKPVSKPAPKPVNPTPSHKSGNKPNTPSHKSGNKPSGTSSASSNSSKGNSSTNSSASSSNINPSSASSNNSSSTNTGSSTSSANTPKSNSSSTSNSASSTNSGTASSANSSSSANVPESSTTNSTASSSSATNSSSNTSTNTSSTNIPNVNPTPSFVPTPNPSDNIPNVNPQPSPQPTIPTNSSTPISPVMPSTNTSSSANNAPTASTTNYVSPGVNSEPMNSAPAAENYNFGTPSEKKATTKYVKVAKAIFLHTSRNFTKRNTVSVVKPGIIFKIEKSVKAHSGARRYEIKYNKKNYFITANKRLVNVCYKTTKHANNSVNNYIHYRYAKVVKTLQLHTSARFTKRNGIKVVRPGAEFRIDRIVKNHGLVRYEIRYQGHNYFITANRNYIVNAYLQRYNFRKHGYRAVRVIKSLNEYRKLSLTKRGLIRHFNRGSVLPVKRVITLNRGKVTRLRLTNGRYVTANKDFVKVIK